MGLINRYKIVSIDESLGDIKIFKLAPEDGKIPSYVSGQFVFIHALDQNGKSIEKRPYSVASSPTSTYLEFCIKMINGKMTNLLDKVKIGEVVGIEGPVGGFTYTYPNKAVFIAGGTGIAPIISMLRSISEKKETGEFIFFYSVKTEDHIIYKKELEDLTKKNQSIKVIVTLTQVAQESTWKGERGRFSKEMFAKYIRTPSDANYWICGPLVMIKEIKENLVSLGADMKKMKLEGWG